MAAAEDAEFRRAGWSTRTLHPYLAQVGTFDHKGTELVRSLNLNSR
ncbi:hypothetical protein ACFU76_14715 [Streptomyces sp. NPDC057539]